MLGTDIRDIIAYERLMDYDSDNDCPVVRERQLASVPPLRLAKVNGQDPPSTRPCTVCAAMSRCGLGQQPVAGNPVAGTQVRSRGRGRRRNNIR